MKIGIVTLHQFRCTQEGTIEKQLPVHLGRSPDPLPRGEREEEQPFLGRSQGPRRMHRSTAHESLLAPLFDKVFRDFASEPSEGFDIGPELE